MRSFITGSHCYGKPNEESDVDLVILINHNDYDKLKRLADAHDDPGDSTGGPESFSLVFGKLNLLCCLTDNSYAVWKLGTIRCEDIRVKERKPVGRKRAINIFNKLREIFLGEPPIKDLD